MKRLQYLSALSLLTVLTPAVALAQGAAGPVSWHASSLLPAIGYMLVWTGIGVFAAIAGYRLFDKCTPGDLHKEIIENKNVAAALVGSAVILGVCIIVAAAMVG